MPPITRRAQSGSGVLKKVTRKQRAPVVRNTSSSWDFIDTNDDDVRESVEVNNDERSPELDGAGDLEEAVKPLRDIEDKVGKEMELFAMEFDTFLGDLPTCQNKYDAAKAIVLTFQGIAEDAVRNLQRTHQKERMEQLRKEWTEQAQLSTATNPLSGSTAGRAGVVSGMKAEKVKELRQWQQEVDIWELFWTIIDFWYNRDARRKEQGDRLANLPLPHRYTSEKDIWERFLLDNEIAKEHSIYKQWLEQTADRQETDLPGIMQELEAKSGTGKGLWNRGWLNTREKIKGEKRVRSWPNPSDSVQPQIRTSAGNDMLVTTLDPDAPTRQERALEKPDKYFERAMWIACWEMLRRGKPWQEIVAWCEDHNEGWRAAVLNPALDSSDALSNAAWRTMCYLASESGCSNDYEAAVYGLLGGNVKAVQKLCRTVDDHLFAHYSCTLVRQFELYLQNRYPGRVSFLAVQRAGSDDVLDNEEKARDVISRFVGQLRGDQATREEAVSPLKIIESYLLANDAETLAAMVGGVISDLDSLRGGNEQMVIRTRPVPQQMCAEVAIALDSHALRIVTHIYLVLTAIDENEQPTETLTAEENVLVAYIQAVRSAGKRDHTPVYCSRLRPARAIVTAARILQDVVEPKEQQQMLGLMDELDMEVVDILEEQLRWTLTNKAGLEDLPERPLRILEECDMSQLHPGQRIINGFIDESMTEDDFAIVRSLQWFQLLPGHWHLTFSSLANGLRTCLLTGRLACAVEIVRNFPCEVISQQKSYRAIGRSVNVMDKNLAPIDEDSEEGLEWELLRRQSRSYYELEQLVHAIEALALWVSHERPFTSAPRPGSSVPTALRKAKGEMDECMAPLLTGILLQVDDEEERHFLDKIRLAYLPEVIIAYNTALYTAGPTISRDSYIESMDLSVSIASETNGLAECFTKAGRMRELVNGFAQASKMMLVMKANGRPRKPNKAGKDLGVWEIGRQGAGAMAGVVQAPDLS